MDLQNITNESKVLIEIYRLFYKENPNFSDKNINIKIQTMMFILFYFGLPFRSDYGFHLLGSKKIPISWSLSEDVKALLPLGEVKDNNQLIELSKDSKRRIEIVRNILFKNDMDFSNIDELITNISKIIYIKEYCLSSKSGLSEIADFTNCPIEEIDRGLQIVKRIESQFGKMFKNNNINWFVIN